MILEQILFHLNISKVTISGVGIREGVFLSDLLRRQNGKFPDNFHIGMCYLRDNFIKDEKLLKLSCQSASLLFDRCQEIFSLDEELKIYLKYAAYFLHASDAINSYKKNEYASHFVLSNRIYNLSYRDRLILSIIVKYSGKKLLKKRNYEELKKLYTDEYLLPFRSMYWLCFITMFINNLIFDHTKKIDFMVDDEVLTIQSEQSLILEQQAIQKIDIPSSIQVVFE